MIPQQSNVHVFPRAAAALRHAATNHRMSFATAFRGAMDYPRLDRSLGLPSGQFVTFAQTVGYPLA